MHSNLTLTPVRLRKPRALFFLAVVLLLTGCLHVQFIGDYDPTIDQGVTDVQQKAEDYLTRLKSNPGTPYDPAFYDSVNARLATLKTRAASLPKYEIIAGQIANLQAEFDKLQQLDKISNRPFPAGAAGDAEAAIARVVESILKLELALKSAGKVPPGLK